jgi:DNA-binding transcriptional ArsR family regulator
MLRFEVTADDLVKSRFALSPIFELNAVLRALAAPVPGLPAAWVALLRPRFAGLREHPGLAAVLTLRAGGSGATCIAPPPAGLGQTIEQDLLAVRNGPVVEARQEIEGYLSIRRPATAATRDFLRATDVLDRLADFLALAWERLVADDWPRLRAVCDRDVVHRAAELSRAGWAAAVDGLGPKIRWRRGGIEITGHRGAVDTLAGNGLLLVPSAAVRPGLAVFRDDPWPKAIVYPARGVGSLFERTPAAGHEFLAALIGRTRARLLSALAEPASTTQLAGVLGLATGAVGDHVSVLYRAGLLTRSRSGRSVLYQRLPLADALMDSATITR